MRPGRPASTPRLLALISALLLLGLTLAASPAHAAKPDSPPGQSKANNTTTANAENPRSTQAKAAKPEKAQKAPQKASSHATSGTSGTSGDVKSPQPLSKADKNTGGANGKCPGGPYCSTRDGSPSLNGNGGGKATGKPCAGCVGKADNKNPKGQYPNGSDHNQGYECDGNNGIGKTNPAHTGCKPTAPPNECPAGTTGTPPDCVPVNPPTCPEGTTGTPPNCVPVPPETCPDGFTGTPPNCENVEPPGDCPPGMTGVFPDCESVLPPPGNPGNPDEPTGSVAGPKAPTAASAPTTTAASALPQTGAGATMLGTGIAGLLMLLGGAVLVARKVRTA